MRQTLDFGDIQFKESGEISRRGLNPTPKLGNLDPPLDRARLRDKFIFPTDLFSGSLILYLVLFLIENIFPGVISREFSLNYLLIPVLIFGVLSSIFPEPEKLKVIEVYRKSDIVLSFVLSIIGAGLIYYKIDLAFNLRLIIACISGVLILMMSLLVILPEDFVTPKIVFRKKHLWYLLLLPIIIYIFWRINRIPKIETVIRIAPDKYNVILVNRTSDPKYSETYKKLLINNGYKNVAIDEGENIAETTSKATVMYGPKDSVAGREITDIIGLSYKDIQTSPIIDKKPQTIIVVLK